MCEGARSVLEGAAAVFFLAVGPLLLFAVAVA